MAQHNLADWIRNAAPETLESLGLRRKGEGTSNSAPVSEYASPVPPSKPRQRAKPRQLEHNEQVRLFQEIEEVSLIPQRRQTESYCRQKAQSGRGQGWHARYLFASHARRLWGDVGRVQD